MGEKGDSWRKTEKAYFVQDTEECVGGGEVYQLARSTGSFRLLHTGLY